MFAPLVGLTRVRATSHEAIAARRRGASSASRPGIFTNDMRVVEEAFDRIDVGGLMVNDVSTFRDRPHALRRRQVSGFGREGLRYAIEEMTELKLLTTNRRA